MIARGRTLKFTAVIVLVVLALTGFSTGSKGSRGSKGRHSSSHYGSGGGGCSSSRQDHDTSTSSTSGGSSYGDDDDDTYGGSGGSSYTRTRRPTYRSTPTSSSGGTAKPLKDGTVKLVSCANEKAQYATVEVTNPNNRETSFEVRVDFEDDQDLAVGTNTVTVVVPAKGRLREKVRLRDSTGYINDGLIYEVDHCRANPVADAVD